MSSGIVERTFDDELGIHIISTLVSMINKQENHWTRAQILNSDEAARAIIARLPEKFRSIDCNHFRRIADPLEKKSYENGGFPRFTDRKSCSSEDSLVSKVEAWAQQQGDHHSEEYKRVMADPAYRDWCRDIKRKKGYQCAACGVVTLGDNLQIHHYTYARLGHEQDDDVCCVCAPSTGRCCHPILDLARVAAKTQRMDVQELF